MTNTLLRKLADAKIIDSATVLRIRALIVNSDKVDNLLDVVELCDKSLLPVFCQILIDVDQKHVVDAILPDGF